MLEELFIHKVRIKNYKYKLTVLKISHQFIRIKVLHNDSALKISMILSIEVFYTSLSYSW